MSAKNLLLTAIGFLLLGIGAVGVVLPILPTTPFVITASACFAGNPRIRGWLMKSRFFAEHITNYRQRTGLRKDTVAVSLAFLWGMLSLSMLAVGQLRFTLLFIGIGIAVTVHILWIARPKERYYAAAQKENDHDQ